MQLPILFTISIVFAMSVLAQGAQLVMRWDPLENLPQTEGAAENKPTFTELDKWEAELETEARRVGKEKAAADLALAEARRARMDATRARSRRSMTEARAKKLATMYGAMEPALAAETLSELTIEKSSMIVAEMAPGVAGPILAAMPPVKSRKIADFMLQAN